MGCGVVVAAPAFQDEDTMTGALREAFKRLVQETIAENNQLTANSDPEEGVVTLLNDNGTVNVQTSTNSYIGVGTPVFSTLGSQVLVVTADGRRIAIPR